VHLDTGVGWAVRKPDAAPRLKIHGEHTVFQRARVARLSLALIGSASWR
jgi:hypothetical protein